MSPAVKTTPERVATWPENDQEELAEVAREIEARRTGIYELTADEEAKSARELRTSITADRSAKTKSALSGNAAAFYEASLQLSARSHRGALDVLTSIYAALNDNQPPSPLPFLDRRKRCAAAQAFQQPDSHGKKSRQGSA
jgi:hypothetical protein